MSIVKNQNWTAIVVLSLALTTFSSCLTSKKMDRFVAEQYNNQLPKQDKKKKADIVITSAIPSDDKIISSTVQKTSKVLPLIFYWQFDYRHTTQLNPAIGVANFSNALNTLTTKGLSQKLADQRLELTVEQVPSTFALVDKAHIIWLVYAISWDKIFIEPDTKDLVVSYKFLQKDNTVKTGNISIKNTVHNKGIRYFQSWKSATSEHLADYNTNMTAMTKAFITKLMEEL